MNEQVMALSLDQVRFHLAGIVRDIEQEGQVVAGKKVAENATCVVTEDFTIGQRTIDCRSHRAQVALADLRVDRRTGKLAVGKCYARRCGRQSHFFQELGSDLVT